MKKSGVRGQGQGGRERFQFPTGLLKAMRPIFRSSAAVSDSPDGDFGRLFGINDGKRKPPEQKSPGVVLAYRPALRRFTDCVGGTAQFLDEVQGGLRLRF